MGLSCLGLVSKGKNWFPVARLSAYQERIDQITIQYDTVITYGFSQGGYAAIKHARRFHANIILAFSPQFSIDPAVSKHDTRWAEFYRPEIHQRMEPNRFDTSGRVIIVVDPHDRLDLYQVERIGAEIPSIEVVRCHYAGHATVRVVSSSEGFATFLQSVLNGQSVEYLQCRLREYKRRSHGFYLKFGHHCLSRQHPKYADFLCKKAAELAPKHPEIDALRTSIDEILSGQKAGVTPLMTTADGASHVSEEAVARALYRVFLFRDPDPAGFASAIQQLRSGRNVEELLNWCLRSPEFATRWQRFIDTYVGPQAAPAPGKVPVPLRYVPLDAPAMRVECHASPSELAELIHRIGEAWTSMGSTRPYHSVLSAENFLPENINKEAIDAFWASGSKESARVQSMLMKHGFDSTASKICVEYGCGVGRVTSPLARMFKEVYAYDVSSTRLEMARARAESTNIEFVLCTHDIFRTGLQKCDFFYSNIVLQHNPPPLIQKLISIALEALRPGGIAIFQVPTYASGYSFRIREYLDRQKQNDMEMHVFPQPEIFALIATASCELREVREDGHIGRVGQWISNTFVVRRPRPTLGFGPGQHGA